MDHSTPTPLQIVEGYLQALRDRDVARAGSFLATRDFEFVSPTHHFTSAGELLSYLELSTPIVHGFEVRKTFVDGDDVCQVFRVVSQISERKSSEVAQWAQVHEGRIRRIEMFYDAYEYRMLFADDHGQGGPAE